MTKTKNPVLDFIKATTNEKSYTLEDGRGFGEVIDTGIYTLNLALSGDAFGGMITGRTTELAGSSQSGKTALSTYLMEKFLQHNPDNGVVYLYETEGRVSESLSKLISPEFRSRVIINHVSTVDEYNIALMQNLLPQLQKFKNNKQDIKVMIVLDSLGNLASHKEMTDMKEKQELKADMTRAKAIRRLFRTIAIPLLSEFQIPHICTNHTYDVVGSFITYKKAGGGGGVEYLSDIIIEAKKDKQDKDIKKQNKVTKFLLKIKKSLFTDVDVVLPIIMNNGKFSKYSGILNMAKELNVVKLVDYVDEEKIKDIETRRKEISDKVKSGNLSKTQADRLRKQLTEEKKEASEKKYQFENGYYSKIELSKNEEILNKIVIATNEAWKEEYSFLVDTTQVDEDLDTEDEVEETEIEDEE